MSKDELRISLSPPRLSALRDVSRMVEAFGAVHRLDESRVYMLNLALDELVSTFADRVTYQFTEGENRLTLEHNHAPVDRPEDADAPMDVEVAEERRDGVLVLSPVGRLDSGNVNAFEASVMKRVRSGERCLILDFSRLDFISSSGLRVLLLAAKALKAGSGTLVVCSMKPHIEEVFRVSGFDRFIPVKATLAAALESCA